MPRRTARTGRSSRPPRWSPRGPVPGQDAARIYRPRPGLAAECYRHYAICGEARFAAKFFGHAVSRAVLVAPPVRRQGIDRGDRPSDPPPTPWPPVRRQGRPDPDARRDRHAPHHRRRVLPGRAGRPTEGDLWEIVSVHRDAGHRRHLDHQLRRRHAAVTLDRRRRGHPDLAAVPGPADRGRLPVPVAAADPGRDRVAHPAHLRPDHLAGSPVPGS